MSRIKILSLSQERFHLVEAAIPAVAVAVASFHARKEIMAELDFRRAVTINQIDRHDGFLALYSLAIYPVPGEDQTRRRFDFTIDAMMIELPTTSLCDVKVIFASDTQVDLGGLGQAVVAAEPFDDIGGRGPRGRTRVRAGP